MTESGLTSSLEDYLEAIYELSLSNENVRSTQIAEKLQVKRPSVTTALQILHKKGFLNYDPYSPITLTEQGRAEAVKVLRRHKTMAIFFEKVLGITPKYAQEAACQVEHAIDSEITTRLVEFVEFIDSCPRIGIDLLRESEYHCRARHDNRQCARCIRETAKNIEKSTRTLDLGEIHNDSCSLDEVEPGSSVLIVTPPSVSTGIHLPSAIKKGSRITVEHRSDKDGEMEIESAGERFSLTAKEARNIEVLLCDK